MSQLFSQYRETIAQALKNELELKNTHAVPSLVKIVVNMGVKNALSDKKNMEQAIAALTQITGQKPKKTRAKKAIASFKLRLGDEIGLMVTLRGRRMYDFFEKLTKIVLPRIRDFRGVSSTSFDGHGNYTLGLSEYVVFPEIDAAKVTHVQGLEIAIVTTAKDDAASVALMEKLGMPFQKSEKLKAQSAK